MNFQTINARKLKVRIKICENMTHLSTEILIIAWHAEI